MTRTDDNPALGVDRLAEIRAALTAVPAPPWHWIGDVRWDGPILATKHSGWKYVMGFARLGFRGAQPTFPVADERGYALMTSSRDIEALAASTAAARGAIVPRAPYDPNTIRGIDNPVARFLEHAAQYVAELLAELDRLQALRTAPRSPAGEPAADVTAWSVDYDPYETGYGAYLAKDAAMRSAEAQWRAFCNSPEGDGDGDALAFDWQPLGKAEHLSYQAPDDETWYDTGLAVRPFTVHAASTAPEYEPDFDHDLEPAGAR